MGETAGTDGVYARVAAVGGDASEGEVEVLLAKGREGEEGFEEPTDAAFVRAGMVDSAALDGTGMEEEGSAGVGDLEAGTLGELLDEAEERDLVGLEAGLVLVGANAVDADGAAGEEGEDEAMAEVGLAGEGEHSRVNLSAVDWSWPVGERR